MSAMRFAEAGSITDVTSLRRPEGTLLAVLLRPLTATTMERRRLTSLPSRSDFGIERPIPSLNDGHRNPSIPLEMESPHPEELPELYSTFTKSRTALRSSSSVIVDRPETLNVLARL